MTEQNGYKFRIDNSVRRDIWFRLRDGERREREKEKLKAKEATNLSLLSLQPNKCTVEYSNQKREREEIEEREREEREMHYAADGPPMCQLRTQREGDRLGKM